MGHHAKYFRGACQRSFFDQFSRMQRGNSNALSRKMLTVMYNSLELINNYFTKPNSCKMRERERVMISENGTDIRRYTSIYMYI
jgi:hypothetical protein